MQAFCLIAIFRKLNIIYKGANFAGYSARKGKLDADDIRT